MTTYRQQQGFTLIEMLVVVMIVATISAMSVLAINQAFGRRYVAEADRLLSLAPATERKRCTAGLGLWSD
jgi:prepilin-type N-terminal cleavage/methylation domain-containing protein